MKRKTYMQIKSGSKFLLITILILTLLIGAVAGTAFYIHDTHTKEEITYLQTTGMVNLVSINEDIKMNVAVRGSLQAKHTFVTIAGMGYSDFGIYMDHVTKSLQKENRLVIVDRLGAGFSDDTTKERTCDAIVEEYRKALQKSLIDAPYVLLAHEIGAAYATRWQSLYPNEIEGIIYIDPNPVNDKYQSVHGQDNAFLMSLGCKLGLQRILYNQLYTPESIRLPSDYIKVASYFNTHSTYTSGYLAEVQSATKNWSTTMNSLQSSNIPKMYINSSYAFETNEEALEYIDYINAQAHSVGQEKVFENPASAADNLVSQSQAMSSQIDTYVQGLGNCHLVKMPGGPSIYEQHPGVFEAAIVDFINFLDGTVDSLQNRYVDKVLEEWQQEQEQQTEVEETTEPLLETES